MVLDVLASEIGAPRLLIGFLVSKLVLRFGSEE